MIELSNGLSKWRRLFKVSSVIINNLTRNHLINVSINGKNIKPSNLFILWIGPMILKIRYGSRKSRGKNNGRS